MRSALDKSSPPLVNQDVRDDGGARGPVPAPAGVVAGGQGFEFGLAFRGGQQGLQFLLPLREGFRGFHAVRLSEESGPAVQEGLDGFGVCAPRCSTMLSTPEEDGSGGSEEMPCLRS